MSRPDAERVWLAFAQHAVSGLSSQIVEIDPAVSSWEKVNRSIADDAAEIADEMLERWRLRYEDDAPKVKAATVPVVPPPIDW